MNCHNGKAEQPLGKVIATTGGYIARTNNRMIKESGLTLSFETSILIHWLSFNPGAAQHDLRHCMDRDKARIARVIDSLEKQGLVRREIDREDRRIKRIHLTEKGRKLDARLSTIRHRVQDIATREISPEEIRRCRQTLEKIINNLENENFRGGEPVQSPKEHTTDQEGIQ